MKLLLIGHTERYPVEQLQMQLFPDEPSEFVTHRFTGDGTVSSLSRGKKYLTATAKVTKGGKTGFASRRIPLEDADVRMTRRILQQSYYLAATKVLGTVPPWGALSGVRPTKLSTKCMLEGGSEKDAAKLLENVFCHTRAEPSLCRRVEAHAGGRETSGAGRLIRLHRHSLLPDEVLILLVCERVDRALRCVPAALLRGAASGNRVHG